MKKKLLIEFSIVISILFVLSLPFWLFDIDIIVSDLFYTKAGGFVYGDNFPWQFLYEYGPLPAFIVFFSTLLYLVLSFFIKKPFFRKFRMETLYLALVMLIGPGLVVNVIFKDNWGRPRPRQVVEFGGKHEHLKLWEKGEAGVGKSFSSGHASMGFYFFALYFIARARRWKHTKLCFWAAMGAGLLIGAARIVQGGHFLSDVIWSGGFLYLVSFALYILIFKRKQKQELPSQA